MFGVHDSPDFGDSPEGDGGDGDDEYIFDRMKRHPRVCSTCFRLRHIEDPVPRRIAETNTHGAQSVTPERARLPHAHKDAPPGERVSERTPTTVCECGAVRASTQADTRPLDMRTALEYTVHLSQTLAKLADEAAAKGNTRRSDEYRHDPDALFDAVKGLKSRPDMQFKDDLIFRAATEVACRRA